MTGFHHVELWVVDFDAALPAWAWLLGELGWPLPDTWANGASWGSSETGYVVVEQSPDVRGPAHDRLSPGMNHLALWAADRVALDRLVERAPANGWQLLFADRHPYAGGPGHCAAYLEDAAGFEVEVVVRD